MRKWSETAWPLYQSIKSRQDAGRVALPQTAVEWADEHFYLSSESSGTVGRWETLPFQVGILNVMGSPDVQKADVLKSARVGYTKMLMAAVGYFLVKKKRSTALWQPTDGDRDEFVKSEIDSAVRDVPVWRNALPSFGKKSKDNTLEYKAFIGASFWCKGGTSAKNFRRISPDVVALDELDAFPHDIDGEGDADSLSWKRAEVSSFRKQIKGSSPKEKGSSQIEDSAERADAFLKYHVQCQDVDCAEFSPLEFGGTSSKHGLKWEKNKPDTVEYICKHCGVGWKNSQLHDASVNGYWADEKAGISTKDGLLWRKDGEPVAAPKHVAFHIWSAYSPFTTWREIVRDWLEAQGHPLKLKAFVNTTLGETWEAVEGDQVKAAQIKARPRDPMPKVLLVTVGVDVQPDRFENQYLGHCLNGDTAVLGYEIIPAETDRLQDWKDRLTPAIERSVVVDGREFAIEAIGVDTGGSSTSTAYDYCALNAHRHVLALKGVGGDRPIIPMRPARNWKKRGLDGWVVGTNAAKDLIFACLSRTEGDGRVILPEGVDLPADYADQLTSERRTMKIKNGRKTFTYTKRSQSARNEALDTMVYGIAAKKWLEIHKGVDLALRSSKVEDEAETDWSSLYS